jgi:gliding motility-associated protein GldM
MAGGKQTPRQKMIGLMYLVFISLMALNVSVTVMDSFVLIDEGIKQTNVNFTKRVEDVYRDFSQQMALAPDKVRPFYERAVKVKELSDTLANYILFSRADMISRLDKIPKEVADTLSLMDLRTRSQYSASSRYWIQEGNQDPINIGGQGTRAYELKMMIVDFKSKVAELIPEEHRSNLQLGLNTEGPFYSMHGKTEITWQSAMFDRIIPIAIATNLSRLVTEVRNAEFESVSRLYAAITAEDFTFDKIEARVVPRSQIVLLGDHYEADVFVAAYDTKQNPTIIVDGRNIDVKEGVGKLRIPAGAVGSRSFKGQIQVPNPVTGQITPYEFKGDYIVQRPSVTVSADAMNVFYIGVDNPVSVSVPGIANENIRPVISSGGTLIPRGDGKYTVRMAAGIREAKITVNASIDGANRNMGSAEFRVRRIPTPIPKVSGLNSGETVARERMLAVPRVIADLEGFDFEAKYEIISFTMYTMESGDLRPYTARGGTFSNEIIGAINRGRRGQRFVFDDIIARGPDNANRSLSAVTLRLE